MHIRQFPCYHGSHSRIRHRRLHSPHREHGKITADKRHTAIVRRIFVHTVTQSVQVTDHYLSVCQFFPDTGRKFLQLSAVMKTELFIFFRRIYICNDRLSESQLLQIQIPCIDPLKQKSGLVLPVSAHMLHNRQNTFCIHTAQRLRPALSSEHQAVLLTGNV